MKVHCIIFGVGSSLAIRLVEAGAAIICNGNLLFAGGRDIVGDTNVMGYVGLQLMTK